MNYCAKEDLMEIGFLVGTVTLIIGTVIGICWIFRDWLSIHAI